MNIKFLRKINSSYWLRSGSYTAANKVFDAGIGLLTFIILIRLLPTEDFGVWVLFISISTITESTRRAFVYNPLVKYINTSEKEDYDGIITASIVQNVLFTLATSIFIACLAWPLSSFWDAGELEGVLYVFSVSNLFIGFFSQCNFIQQSNLIYNGTFYSFLLRKGLFFVLVLIVFLVEKNITLISLVSAQLIIMILIIPVNIYFTKNLFIKFYWSKEWLYKLINFGKFTIVTNISSMVFQSIDSWMIGSMLTIQAVALYNPAIRILSIVNIPIVSIAIISYPLIARKFKTNDLASIRGLYEKSIGMILAFLIPICLATFIFSDQIILLIAGEKYMQASPILKITILFGLFIPFNRQLGITLNAAGKVKTNMHFVLINLVLNLICNYFGILYFGILGAAYGTLLAYVLSFSLGQVIAYRLFNISLISVFRYIIEIYRNPKKFIIKHK